MTEVMHREAGIVGYGGKGGGGGRVAKEAPDSLHSTQFARILDAISVGPTGGLYNGEEFGLRDIFLNGTPVQNADGSMNWPGVEIHFRRGTQNQDPIPGFPGAENTVAVGFQLKTGTPWAQHITGDEHDAVRITLSTDRLTEQNTKNGDLGGYFIDYAIERQVSGGEWETVLTASMRGKTTKRYTRTHRIELPLRSGPWNIRVRRTSPDSTGQHIASNLYVDAYTTVTDQRLRYPMISLVGYKIPAELFSSIPTRAVRSKGREIRIPSNYNPITRTYLGTWDGSFKLGVSSNPVWVLLDVILSDIFGLGQRINLGMIDRWSLYSIARYCDEMVPDGLGGMEPRFRAVGQIATREDASKLLQDLASIFRGAAFAANGTVVTTADMPAQPVYTYSRANVKGKFRYTGTRRRKRFTVAQVTYNNQEDFGRQKVEPVEDLDGLARYGVRETKLLAFMCPSRGQAHRLGSWTLLTAREQTRGLKFRVGLDYAVVMPGSVVEIADNVLAGAMIGGRVASVVSQSELTLDRRARVKPGDMLTVNLPTGICETRRVNGVEFLESAVKLTVDTFSERPNPEAGWSVSADDLKPQLFRVTGLSHTGPMEVEITALQEVPGKHEAVDFGTKLDPLPTTIIPSREMGAPTNVRLVSNTSVDQGAAIHTMRIEWDGTKNARGYSVQWRRDNSDWIALPDTSLESAEVPGIRAGTYQARVQAVSALEVRSGWALSEFTALQGTLEPPPALTYLRTIPRLYGIGVEWGFPDTISPLRRTEIYWSSAADFSQATLLTERSYPDSVLELSGLPAGSQFWFWGRLVDSLGEKGPLFPPENVTGVHGITNTNAGDYLDAIRDEVVTSEAGRQMLEDLESLADRLTNIGQVVDEQGTTLTQYTQAVIQLGEDLRIEVQARIAGDQAQAAALAQQAGELSEAIDLVSQNLQTEIQNRIQAVDTANQSLQAQIDVLQSQIAEIESIQPWDAGKAYVKDDLVSWNGGLYRAKGPSTNVPPNTITSWEKIGDYSSLAEAVAQNTSEVSGMKIVQASQATRLDTLETSDGQQGSKILTLEQTTAAQAQRLGALETSDGQQGSKIQTLEQTSAAQAQRLGSLETTQGQHGSKIQTLEQTASGLAQRTSTLETTQDQQASKISDLEETATDYALRLSELRATATDQDSSISSLEKVTASSVQAIRRAKVRQDGMASSIEQIETVSAGMAQQVATLETTTGSQGSKIQTLEQTTANLGQRAATLETTQGQQASKISNVEQTQATQAQRLTTLETSDGQQGSRIQDLETTTANLAQRTSTLETTAANTSSRVNTLETATTDLALRVAEVRAMTADTDASVYEAIQATKNNAQMSIRLSARADQNAANIVIERETRLTEKAATATALQNLDTKFDQNAAAIRDEALTRSTVDSALASRIDVMEAKTADGFDSERSWSFDAGLDGWVAFNPANAAIAWVNQSPYFIRATKLTDAIGRVDRILAVAERYDPRQFPIVRARVRFPSTYAANLFTLYVGMDSTGTGTNVIQRPVDGTSTAWQVVDFDLSALSGFATTATVQRLILGDTRPGAYEIDYVAVGRYGVPISRAVYSQDLSVLSTATQANTQVVQRLDAEMGDVTASVQTTNQAVAQLDGRVAANWGVKTQVMDGERVVTGAVSLGADGESSIFAVDVDTFVVFNSSGLTSTAKRVLPFAIVGGQVFMRSALIQDGSITSAKISSAAITNAHLGNAIIGTVNIADGAITSTKIGSAQIHTANINIAQIDTLRLAGGSVTIGISDSFNWSFGKDWGISDRYLQVYMPYGGTCIAFVQFDVDHGNATYPTTTGTPGYVEAVGSDGAVFFQRPANDVVWTGSSPRYAWKGTGSYISPAYSAGNAWGFTARCARPSAGTMYVTGRMAIISFQR